MGVFTINFYITGTQTYFLSLLTADVALMIVSGTIGASAEDEYSRESQTNASSSTSSNATQYDYYTPILEWMPTTKSETQKRIKTTKGGKKVTLKLLYHKAVLFALNKFWDLKVHIRSMKVECNILRSKKIEIQNLTKLLNDVTDIVNNQVDKLAKDAMQNVTSLETMVDPVEHKIIKNISRHFQEMNSSTCELPAVESRQKLLNEVTAADEMLKLYYDKTSRYLTRVKSEILKSGAKFHNNTVLQKYCETSPYPHTESDTFNILRLKVD